MTHLDYLKQEKEIRKRAEEDALRVKMLVMEINNLHSLHNGRFLDELETFIKKYE